MLAVIQQAGQQVGSGQLVGGWNYIWFAYGATWTAIALYALSLWIRRPSRHPEDA